MRRLVPFALTCLTLAFAAPVSAEQGPQIDRLIVKFKPGPTGRSASTSTVNNAMATMRARSDVALDRVRSLANGGVVLKLGKGKRFQDAVMLADSLASVTGVEYVEPDLRMVAKAAPTDPRYTQQWHYFDALSGVNAPAAWDITQGSGVVVAVLDTGVRRHADLAANMVAGYDFISDSFSGNDGNARDADATDPGDWVEVGECGGGYPESFQGSSWHGSHVAGTIAAVAGNSIGGVGVAYRAKIQPVRVLGKCGGYLSDIADAIVWASGGTVSGVPANTTPARVINMSLGSTMPSTCSRTYSDAINAARANGSVVIVAAGNEDDNASSYTPANCAGVVTVAAVARNGARAYYSNAGSVVDVAAPGGAQYSANDSNGVLSTVDAGTRGPTGDTYAYFQGTSMATPHVAGVAALMLSAAPGKTPDQIEEALRLSTRPFVATCSGCGTGMVDASQAVRYVTGAWTPPPATNLKLELVGDTGKFVKNPADETRGTIRYIARVTNMGPNQPSRVTLTNTYPAEVTLQSLTTTGASCSSDGRTCTISALATNAQASVTMTFATTVKTKMPFSGTLESDMLDSDPSNNMVAKKFGGSFGLFMLMLAGAVGLRHTRRLR